MEKLSTNTLTFLPVLNDLQTQITEFSTLETVVRQGKKPILVTALSPVIGYEKAAQITKKAYKEGRPIVDAAEEETNISREELLTILNPEKLTKGGL